MGGRSMLFGAVILLGLHCFGQDKSPATFGSVTAVDFKVAVPGGDTAADAVVISDVGVKTFDPGSYTSSRWLGNLQHTKRILILKRRGFEAATVTIPLQVSKSDHEEITGLKAATYNLENGIVVKTDLDKNSIFKIKVSDNWVAERFTFPAVREGSIVEFTYSEVSPFVISDNSWTFQGAYPCLWSEYTATIPGVFGFSSAEKPALPFCIKTSDVKQADLGQNYGGIRTFHWAVKDAPALTEEPFTTTTRNYLAKVDLRITSYETQAVGLTRDFGGTPTNFYIEDFTVGAVLFSWKQLDRLLLQSDHFGADLSSHNAWLDKDMQEITAGSKDDATKAAKIFAFVRDHFACNDRPGFLMSSTIKTVYKARSGSEAELNLLMTAMLIHAKLDAAAVVLSTRSNGFIDVDIPQPSQLNYVVSKLRLGGKAYYLDASDRDLGFGQLPLECYNGYDIAVDTTELYPENALSADSLTEKTKVVVFLTNGDKGGMDASVQSYPGPAEAVEIRKKMKGPDGEKKFIDGLRAGFPTDESISGLEIDSLGRPDDPMVVNYNCHLDMDSAADKLYITPTMVGRLAVNPFKETERHYPVEMPYARDENYILTLDIPGGYVVDELPQSTQILLGDGSYFEYVMSHDGDQIHFRTRLKLVRANFEPDAYAFLRNFFAAIVDKEGEQIVFRRKK